MTAIAGIAKNFSRPAKREKDGRDAKNTVSRVLPFLRKPSRWRTHGPCNSMRTG